ncbi:MAG TPA: sulfotransferase [Candidatus Binatia bacterium]|nr:sulfotransferase [Candidatus Binatia bacterium]
MEAARDALREAVERNPNDPVAHNDLAVVLCLLGEPVEALQHAKRAVEIRPDLTVAYVNAAVAAGFVAGYEAALPWVDAALEREPDDLAATLLRAATLAKLDRGSEAVQLARRAVTKHPESAQAHEILGVALQAARLYDEALAEFDRAQSRARSGQVGVRKAMMLLEQGRNAEAMRELEVVLQENPTLAVAWYSRALVTDFQVGAHDIAAMQNLLRGSKSLTFNDSIQLKFAIGRACISAGEVGAGFSHVADGNGMKRASIDYSIEADERRMLDIAETFSADFLERHAGGGNLSEQPILVIGMPRSGTSLVEQILASHQLVFGAGELPFIGGAVEGLDPSRRDRLRDAADEYIATLACRAPDAERIIDKMPFNFLHVGFIRLMLPNARIIHCRRDSLDTCLSCYLTLFDNRIGFCYDQTELGRYFRAYDQLMRHWRAILPADRFLEVDYESIVADLEGQARRLVDFCGLPWDETCLAFHMTERPVLTASMNQVRRPIYATSVGRSKNFVSYLGLLAEALGL